MLLLRHTLACTKHTDIVLVGKLMIFKSVEREDLSLNEATAHRILFIVLHIVTLIRQLGFLNCNTYLAGTHNNAMRLHAYKLCIANEMLLFATWAFKYILLLLLCTYTENKKTYLEDIRNSPSQFSVLCHPLLSSDQRVDRSELYKRQHTRVRCGFRGHGH